MSTEDIYVREYPEVQAFWEGTEAGSLLLPYCTACARAHWFPRAHCPLCHAGTIHWAPASGAASLYSYSITWRDGAPWILAYVELDEGPILLSNVVGTAPKDLFIGMRLRVGFRQAATGRYVPVFEATGPV